MKTRRALITSAFAFAGILSPLLTMAQAQKRIQLVQLEAMFTDMRAKTKWDIDGPLLWGYFFFDPDQDKLKRAATDLEAQGYRIVGIQQAAGRPIFRLHVERIETHTPASLNTRNQEFYLLAEKYAIESYDGMDVGPAPPGPK